jgi:hypothetical protein
MFPGRCGTLSIITPSIVVPRIPGLEGHTAEVTLHMHNELTILRATAVHHGADTIITSARQTKLGFLTMEGRLDGSGSGLVGTP